MTTRIPITLNNSRANERWELFLKSKQGRNTFRGSKNDFQPKFGVALLDQPREFTNLGSAIAA